MHEAEWLTSILQNDHHICPLEIRSTRKKQKKTAHKNTWEA